MSWRLVSEVLAYTAKDSFGNKLIAFAGQEKSSYSLKVYNNLKSILDSSQTIAEKSINSEGFEVFIECDNKYPIKIKSPKLSKDVYCLVNFDYSASSFISLLSSLHIEDGKLVELSELVINSDLGLVRFVQKNMPCYKLYHNELIRRVNCDIFKKTSKWLPGHRYDSIDETFIYLGLVSSHSRNDDCSEFFSKVFIEDFHLVISGDIDTSKSIEDILKDSILNGTYKLLKNPKTMVDSGKVLDLSDPKFPYNKFINNLIDLILIDDTIDKEDSAFYNKLSILLNVLKIETSGEYYTIDSNYKNKIESYLETLIRERVIPDNWERPQHSFFKICESNSLDQNTDSCFNILIRRLNDNNVKKQIYFEEFFKYFGIEVKNIIKDELSKWLPSEILNDFDNICKYSGRMYELSKTIIINLRTSASSKYELKNVTLKDSLVDTGDLILIDTIRNIVSKVRSDIFNNDIASYTQINVGSSKSPMIYENFSITLKNIVDHYKEMGLEIPENLKNEIILNKFCQVDISVDKGGEII